MAAVDKLVCVCVCTWLCSGPVPHGSVSTQSVARHGHEVAGGGAADTAARFKEMERGDVGREQNRAAFVLPSAEPGKTLEPPVSACTSRQGGKWTYRCCTVFGGGGKGGVNNVPYIPMTDKWRWTAECSVEKISPPSLQGRKQTHRGAA